MDESPIRGDLRAEFMKNTPQPRCAFEFVHVHFDPILNSNHGLFQRAAKVDRTRFDVLFAERDSADSETPGSVIRLMSGLWYLKYAFDKSDESVVMEH